jgi:hypothetical protein
MSVAKPNEVHGRSVGGAGGSRTRAEY